MITHLHLRSGASQASAPLVIEAPPSITIFVGPNNAGKSQALRDITSHCRSGQFESEFPIVQRLAFRGSDEAAVNREFAAMRLPALPGEPVPQLHSVINVGNQRQVLLDQTYLHARMRPNEFPAPFAYYHLQWRTLNLDGSNRIQLLAAQGQGDLKNPQGTLAKLLVDNARRELLRGIIHDAVGLYFAIDMAVGGQLQVRFGETAPPNERSVDDEILNYMRAAKGVEQVSDGVKAFAGILMQLYAGNPDVIIVDEPEAFLHPSLANKLGKELAKGAASQNKHVFVATHSPQFVMGAISSGATVNIVRLTYESGIGTARLLSNDSLRKFMLDPMLRSVGILEGLFYNYVIVGEADADRAFYQEINERLRDANDARGIPHALFLNADNVQTIPKIVAPLRMLGIPTVGIADVDILHNGGQDWTSHLSACSVPTPDHQPYGTRRANTDNALKAKSDKYKTSGGVNLLTGDERRAADDLLDDLERFGLFVVRQGEVENWLSNIGVSRSKHPWRYSIFEKMGSDPTAAGYIRPAVGDVWDFIGRIKTWLTDPRRRGIPQ